jgi:hypothetical protein
MFIGYQIMYQETEKNSELHSSKKEVITDTRSILRSRNEDYSLLGHSAI